MADAPTMEAPSKPKQQELKPVKPTTKEERILAIEFDTNKKYMFELAAENLEREIPIMEVLGTRATALPQKKHQPYRNLVMTSQVIWNGQRRMLRYYDGCSSIFADEQPKDEETIKQFIAQTSRRHFNDGKLGVFGDERMLLLYLTICSWNVESEFRTRTAAGIFKPVNKDKQADLEAADIDLIEKALQLAKEASSKKMSIHANFLEIPLLDYDSNNELTEKEIRTAYRKWASKHPSQFIESYGNPDIETKYYINKAWADGIVQNKSNKNKAMWRGTNTEICDIGGLTSHEGITQRLYEFAKSEQGEEFVIQLKAVMEKE